MTEARDYRDYLADMVKACRAAIGFVASVTLEGYFADQRTVFAVMRAFEMLGEAARHVPEEIKTTNPEIPWTVIVAMRNRVVHGYFGVDELVLYFTARNRLPELLPIVERLARDHGVEV